MISEACTENIYSISKTTGVIGTPSQLPNFNFTAAPSEDEQITTTNPPTQPTAVNLTEPLMADDSCQTLFASCSQEKTGRNCSKLLEHFEKECYNSPYQGDSCSLGCTQSFKALLEHPHFKDERSVLLFWFPQIDKIIAVNSMFAIILRKKKKHETLKGWKSLIFLRKNHFKIREQITAFNFMGLNCLFD